MSSFEPSSEELQKQRSKEVNILQCMPCSLDSPTGEDAVTVTFSSREGIESVVFNMKEARLLAGNLLIALATNEDRFARIVLEEMFPSDKEGMFYYPSGDEAEEIVEDYYDQNGETFDDDE